MSFIYIYNRWKKVLSMYSLLHFLCTYARNRLCASHISYVLTYVLTYVLLVFSAHVVSIGNIPTLKA